MIAGDPTPLPVPPSLLGESPFWHPAERVLYWCDIDGQTLNRWNPARGWHEHWSFDSEPGCVAPRLGGGLLLALRDGLWHFDPVSGQRQRVADAPYDPAEQRFNDGKADARGRFWVGTVHERREPLGALYLFDGERLRPQVEGAAVANGLAFAPDGRTLYWADTRAHTVWAFDVDAEDGSLSGRRVFASFPPKPDDGDLSTYVGRPDGAAVDAEGCYWIAMFEGARLLRLSPAGERLFELPLPVQCPTMPCFGGDDLKTLYITSARHHRPPQELMRQPFAGCVLQLRVEVPGLPVNFAL